MNAPIRFLSPSATLLPPAFLGRVARVVLEQPQTAACLRSLLPGASMGIEDLVARLQEDASLADAVLVLARIAVRPAVAVFERQPLAELSVALLAARRVDDDVALLAILFAAFERTEPHFAPLRRLVLAECGRAGGALP